MRAPPHLQKPAYLVPLVLASVALIQLLALWRGVGRARELAARGRRFERRLEATGPAILILGDSTGVGVGAGRPEESIAGLLAADFPDADIVNISVSGARVSDTVAQVRKCNALGLRFDLALLHVGGNDIVRATPTETLADACEELLVELSRIARRTVWLGPPNIGWVPLFPPPFSWLFAARSRAMAAVFARSAARHGVAFVDFSAPEHGVRLSRKRRQHFAIDGFHPNSSTYRYGYATARRSMGLDAEEEPKSKPGGSRSR